MGELDEMEQEFRSAHPDKYWTVEIDCPSCGSPIKLTTIGMGDDGKPIVRVEEVW